MEGADVRTGWPRTRLTPFTSGDRTRSAAEASCPVDDVTAELEQIQSLTPT